MKKLAALIGVGLLVSGVACAGGKKRVGPDAGAQSTGSVMDGDATALIEGCGNQPIVGFTYCRVEEEEASYNGSLTFIGPPAICTQEEDSCVFIKVWNQDGSLVWGGSIPRGRTRVNVAWASLIGRNHFEISDRGLWTWSTQVFWMDRENRERSTTAQGDIVLRVYRKGYMPLHTVQSDPSFAWGWQENGYQYQMTSGLRANVKKLPTP